MSSVACYTWHVVETDASTRCSLSIDDILFMRFMLLPTICVVQVAQSAVCVCVCVCVRL